jgi:tetratricopeptide (TPR) repeat protein
MHRSLLCILIALLLCSVSFQVNAQTAGGASYDLGVFAYEEGNFKEAEAHFKKALEAAPEDPSTNHYLGKTLMAQERYDEAQKYFNAAWKKDSALPGLAYDRAYGFYKMGEYGKGADLFIEVVKVEPDHILSNFFGGVCLYRKGRYQEANPYLMSAAEKSPELKVKGYYFSGLCHYYMGQEEQASQKLTFVQANSTSSDVKRNAERWLKRIREGKKAAKPYELEFKIGFAYDDNAPLEPKDQEIFSDEKDTVLLGYVAGRYHVNTKPNMELGLGISRAQSWYTELDELNSSETALQFYGYYYTDPFSYGINLRPVLYQVDAEDFLLTYQAIPQMTYRFSKALVARAFYTYSANDYRQDVYDDRDGSTHEGFLDTIYSLSGDRGYLLGGIGYEANTASADIYDYGRLNIKFAMEYGMAWGLTLKMIGKFSNKFYKNENPFENKKRQDHHYEGSISLARKLNYNWLQIALEHNFMKNDSNMSDYEYTRQVTGVVLIANF